MDSQKPTIRREIGERFGMIKKTDQNIEINIVSWNGGMKKLDIRPWSTDGKYVKKGITFNREEFYSLMDILSRVDPLLIDSRDSKSSAVPSVHQEQKQASYSQNNEKVDMQNEAVYENRSYDAPVYSACEHELPIDEYVEFPAESHEMNSVSEQAS